jgi:adenosine deaminase
VNESTDFLRRLPKVQLHCHLEGTLRAATFIDLARKHGVALTYDPRGNEVAPAVAPETDPESVYNFQSFQQFLMTFAAVSRSLALPEDYERLAAEYVEDAVAQSVLRAEIFVSPSVWQFFHPDIDVRECMKRMRDVFDSAKNEIEVVVIADVTRNFGTESALRSAHMALELQDLGVIGIGLGGDEARYPAELFENVFQFARSEGLHAVAHAGEAAGAESVRMAVEALGAERIGHGVRAIEDEHVVAMLARERIPLEVCPTSNFLTGAAVRGKPHPLIALDAAGCMVTIDGDDPALFRTSVTKEYAYVEGVAGRDAVIRFAHNAINASFAGSERKAQLRAALDAVVGLEPGAPRRTS